MTIRWLQQNLLWVDGLAGAVVGLLMLSMSHWLSDWYQLPLDLLLFMGVVNLLYSTYSTSLARRATRKPRQIVLLAVANSFWGVVCVVILLVFVESISVLGAVHLGAEAVFVGGLGLIEWRWRELLLVRSEGATASR